MGKGFNSKRIPKNNNTVNKKDETPASNNNAPNEETHDKFKESIVPEPVVNTDDKKVIEKTGSMEPTLEPVQVTESIYDTPTVERKYIGDARGVKNDGTTTTPQPNADGTTNQPPPPPPTGDGTTAPPPPPQGNEWQPTPPPPPDPNTAPEADPLQPPGPDGQPFTIPEGTAEETIEWGFEQLNFIIKRFGGTITDVKFGKEFLSKLPPKLLFDITNMINEKNAKSVDRLQFTKQEIDMIKKPLAKGFSEAGIRGLSWKEELAVVCIIVMVGKMKDFKEIRYENKILENNIKREFAKYFATAPTDGETKTAKSNEPEDVDFEETKTEPDAKTE